MSPTVVMWRQATDKWVAIKKLSYSLHLTLVDVHSHHFTKWRQSKRIVSLHLKLRHSKQLFF